MNLKKKILVSAMYACLISVPVILILRFTPKVRNRHTSAVSGSSGFKVSENSKVGTSSQPSNLPTISPTIFPTSIPTVQPSTFPSFTPTSTAYPSNFPSSIPTKLPTYEPSELPTHVPTNLPTVTMRPSEFPTFTPTMIPTLKPSNLPTQIPSRSPTNLPSNFPTQTPSESPTIIPSETFLPTIIPSESPTLLPTKIPSEFPTLLPTNHPSESPTLLPTNIPSESPTLLPTIIPSESPTLFPTNIPSVFPTLLPTNTPSESPTLLPTLLPTNNPSESPTLLPTNIPSESPTLLPTLLPTNIPSESPTLLPTIIPSEFPTLLPTNHPSESPTLLPTIIPSELPNAFPSTNPNSSPSAQPSESPTTLTAQEETFSFYVMGDTPYNDHDADILISQLNVINTTRQLDDAMFMVHVGDLMNRADNCNPSKFIQVKNILLNHSPLPVMTVPGDNDYWDCSDRINGFSNFTHHFVGLENHWTQTNSIPILLKRAPSRKENFVIWYKKILFIGMHIIKLHWSEASDEWNQIFSQNIAWFHSQVNQYGSDARAVIMFGHCCNGLDNPNHVMFDAFRERLSVMNIPFIFIHGNGHIYRAKQPYAPHWKNYWNIQVDMGRYAPPIKVTIEAQSFGTRSSITDNSDLHYRLNDFITLDRRLYTKD